MCIQPKEAIKLLGFVCLVRLTSSMKSNCLHLLTWL